MRTCRYTAKIPAVVFLLAGVTAFAQIPSQYPLCPSGGDCNTPAPCGSGCTDSDNDGLCDSWEVMGGIDLNGDGRIDDDDDDNNDNNDNDQRDNSRDDHRDNQRDLRLPGADPYRPDIYLQYDWMVQRGRNGHSHRPDPKAIRAVVDAFARQGVALHVFPGHALPHHSVVSFEGVDPTCAGNDAVNLYELKAGSFRPQRALAYHYAVFGHYHTCDSLANCALCPLSSGRPVVFRSTGKAELPGNDFVVTTGGFLDFGLTPTIVEEAGLIMHELGHNFGLRHAGTEDAPEFNPHYLSVENRNFTFTGIPIAAASGSTIPISCRKDSQCPAEAICSSRAHTCARIDYSRVALPDLNEYSLDENLGIRAGTNDITTYNCPDTTPVFGAATGPIDWNCNGNPTEMNVVADINADGNFNYLQFLLTGHRDWGNLNLHFQCTAHATNGPTGLFSPTEPVMQTEPSIIEELRKRGLLAGKP